MAEINKQHPLYQEDLQYILKTDGFEQLHGKRFLITGATGLLGTCLIDALMLANQQGAEIDTYAVGRSKEKATPRLGEYYDDTHFHFLEQDVRRPFPTLLQVDYIIPLASNTHPLAYAQYPIETIDINVLGASNALQMAVEQGATVLYPSSVEVYGNARGNDQFTEDYTGQLNLSTARACYTESKRLSEALCQSYIAERGANVKIARLSRIFGPTMLMSDSKASSQFLLKALNDEDIVLKSKGEQLYSYTYAADGTLTSRVTYRWNDEQSSWVCANRYDYTVAGGIYCVEYSRYNHLANRFDFSGGQIESIKSVMSLILVIIKPPRAFFLSLRRLFVRGQISYRACPYIPLPKARYSLYV